MTEPNVASTRRFAAQCSATRHFVKRCLATRHIVGALSVVAILASACNTSTDVPDTAATSDVPDTADATANTTDEMPIKTGYGVDVENKIIRVGVNTDLSGPYTTLTSKVALAQEVYWKWLNNQGGINGWKVEPVTRDNQYKIPKHEENYNELAGSSDDTSVVMFSTSTGSPTTSAIAEKLVEDDIAALPISWYSGWADPAIGENVFEMFANYCVEAINGTTYMSEKHGNKVALATVAGSYGEDGAEGVKIAAEALGLEVVYDGQGQLRAGGDISAVVTRIVNSGADWVWVAADPSTVRQVIGDAYEQGFRGYWAGNGPSWNPLFITLPGNEVFDKYYTHSYYSVLWGMGESEGMKTMIAAMREYEPEAVFDDVYVLGWIQGLATSQILETAISLGDITRAGVLKAARTTEVDMQGIAPNQSWTGDPNDYIVRATYLYDIDVASATSGRSVSDEGNNNGYVLLKGPYISETAKNWDFKPCFVAS